MNKNAQNKQIKISSWYHTDLFSPENKKISITVVIKNNRIFQKK